MPKKRKNQRPKPAKSGARGLRDVWADYDRDSIVVYQAYGDQIADAALAAGKFVAPFSLTRMTWIKPSFLWLMARSNWGTKSGQTRILSVRIKRTGWDAALSEAVLTDPDKNVYRDPDQWRRKFDKARVHVQWDPERSIRGAKLEHRSIQVGIGRALIQTYVDDWTLELKEMTATVRKMRDQIRNGKVDQAKRFLPSERQYPLSSEIQSAIGAV